MPRIPVKNNDWAKLGGLLIAYWRGKPAGKRLKKDPSKELKNCGCAFGKKTPEIELCFDTKQKIHIVIPVCPWSKAQLDIIEQSETYKSQLGMSMLMACR